MALGIFGCFRNERDHPGLDGFLPRGSINWNKTSRQLISNKKIRVLISMKKVLKCKGLVKRNLALE